MKLIYSFFLLSLAFSLEKFDESPIIYHQDELFHNDIGIRLQETPFLAFKDKSLEKVSFEKGLKNMEKKAVNESVYSVTPKFIEKLPPKKEKTIDELDMLVSEIKTIFNE